MFASSACTGRSSVLFWFIVRSIQTKNFETNYIEKSSFSLILYWRYKLVNKILFRLIGVISRTMMKRTCYDKLSKLFSIFWTGMATKKYNMKFQITCCLIPCVSILKMLVTCSITNVTFTYELQLKKSPYAQYYLFFYLKWSINFENYKLY